jgi:hypothetical protein
MANNQHNVASTAKEAGSDSAGYSYSDYNDGVHILVHMVGRTDVDVVFNPPLEDMDALYLEAHFAKNCSHDVVRVLLEPNGVMNLNQSIIGYAIYDHSTSAYVPNPATAVAFQQSFLTGTDTGTGGSVLTSDYPSFSQGNPVILYTGAAANQEVWFQYQHPPLISKDFSGGKLQKMRVTIDSMWSRAPVTLDKMILAFRGYHKKRQYFNPFRPDPKRGALPTKSALSHKF